MQDIEEFNSQIYVRKLAQPGKSIIQNYLENFPGYHHANSDIALAYFNLVVKIWIDPCEMVRVQDCISDFFKMQQELSKSIFDKYYRNQKNQLPVITPEHADKRFIDSEWNEH